MCVCVCACESVRALEEACTQTTRAAGKSCRAAQGIQGLAQSPLPGPPRPRAPPGTPALRSPRPSAPCSPPPTARPSGAGKQGLPGPPGGQPPPTLLLCAFRVPGSLTLTELEHLRGRVVNSGKGLRLQPQGRARQSRNRRPSSPPPGLEQGH